MRKIHWRPRAVSRTALTLIALLSVSGVYIVEHYPVTRQRPYYEEKYQAAELAKKAMDVIKVARVQRGHGIDWESDPAESGMIGVGMSPVTSIAGNITAKRATINPNWSAVVVDMLVKAGVREGDTVAVGVSGSFPALNVAVYSALETLKVKPVVITSGAASQWGANIPDLLWVDMEKILMDEKIFSFRSVAASVGGDEDQGLGMSEEGKLLVLASITRNNVPLLDAFSFEQSIQERMKIYRKQAAGAPIKCYVNVGGGSVSVGRSTGKKLFHPGLNRRPPSGITAVDGVMPRFSRDDVPVIHLVQVLELAERYEMTPEPMTMPDVGQSNVFVGTDYNRWMASGTLVIILMSLYGFIRSDIGFRILKGSSPSKDEGHPQPMV